MMLEQLIAITQGRSMIPTESLKFTEARPRLSELLDRVFHREMRIRLHKGSIPVAAIVSIRDLERLEAFDSQRAERFAALERIGEKFADVPDDELETRIAQAIAAVRAEHKDTVPAG